MNDSPATVFKTELLDPRRAGAVTRWHTWYRSGDQPVSDHCWNLARIILAIWPSAPRETLVHALFHDIGEGVCGDVPYPVKRSSPALKIAFNQLENDAHIKMAIPWGVPAPIKLSEGVQKIFKMCEFIEMWEWSLHQLSMGNKHGNRPAERCLKQVTEILASLREISSLQEIVQNTERYVKRRMDLHEFVTGEEAKKISPVPENGE